MFYRIDIGMTKNLIGNTSQNGMVTVDHVLVRQRRLFLEFSVMSNPGVAQNLLPEASLPNAALEIPGLIRA